MARIRAGGAVASDRAMMTTEFAVVAPVLIIVVTALIVFSARLSESGIQLQSAAQRAARAATLTADHPAASSEADRVADANLAGMAVDCGAGGPQVETRVVDAAGSDVAFGPGVYVRVDITCTVALSDLSALALPGSMTVQRSADELVDVHRGGGP